MFIANIFDQSAWFILACGILAILMIEAAFNYRRPWAVPALVGYATIGAWYLMEPLYLPEMFIQFSSETLDAATLQVIEFMILVRVFMAVFVPMALRNTGAFSAGAASIPASKFLYINAIIWVMLVAIGTYRMDGNIVGALFPISSRAGMSMWSRGAAGSAGASGFLVATAGYVYTLVCASFGMLLPFLKRPSLKVLAALLLILSWPYFLLDGSRNVFLAVFLPSFASYVLFSTPKLGDENFGRTQCCFWPSAIGFISCCNIGELASKSLLEGQASDTVESKHLGLNMMSELCYQNTFYDEGALHVKYGMNYLAELANVIPRALWPGKPFIGIDYAILRGFGGGDQDIGVFATISTGLIGQGFINFGPFFGPLVAAVLFAAWLAILTRFRCQQGSVLRLTLFLLGLGLTFNLGRDITLLVLWPVVFAYILVRILERRKTRLTARRHAVYPDEFRRKDRRRPAAHYNCFRHWLSIRMDVSFARWYYRQGSATNFDTRANLKLVVIFDRFLPYHVARLNAVSRQAELTAIEVAAQSTEYGLIQVAAASSLRKMTFFLRRRANRCRAQALKRKLDAALGRLKPDVVAVPGWSDRAALLALAWCLRTRTPVGRHVGDHRIGCRAPLDSRMGQEADRGIDRCGAGGGLAQQKLSLRARHADGTRVHRL